MIHYLTFIITITYYINVSVMVMTGYGNDDHAIKAIFCKSVCIDNHKLALFKLCTAQHTIKMVFCTILR